MIRIGTQMAVHLVWHFKLLSGVIKTAMEAFFHCFGRVRHCAECYWKFIRLQSKGMTKG